MIQIEDKLVSSELFEEHFICHLEKCLGNCCVFGDAGAPLKDEEAKFLEKEFERIRPFIREEGAESVDKQGKWLFDTDGDKVTPLIKGKECAYTVFENNIAKCGIEKAYEEGAVDFRKPISCHLYPIRLSKVSDYTALNYHRWGVCEPARVLGKKEGLPVFRFLKDSIIRCFGESFYKEMELVYNELNKP
jgi:Protein of unknown function (DUF3109)